MRASVHIKIPRVPEYEGFGKVLEEFHIQERDMHGEHSVSTGDNVRKSSFM